MFNKLCFSTEMAAIKSKMSGLTWALLLIMGAQFSEAILNKGQEASKVVSKTEMNTADKKADQIDAQASHSHSVYGGFGDNNIGSGFGGGFGGEGLGAFGGEGVGGGGFGGYGGGDHHHPDHHDHHHHYYEKDYHKESHHGHGGDGLHKALAIKGLLVPLAGVALLGAAAAFVSNPVLLQLGVISGTYGRRRRREAEHSSELNESAARLEAQTRLSQIKVLEQFMAEVPKEQMYSQEKKLMASYLSCSDSEENACLERLACELHGPAAHNMPNETHVMSIVTNEIFNNDLVPLKTKEHMAEAVRRGREGGDCTAYRCSDLEALIRQKGE